MPAAVRLEGVSKNYRMYSGQLDRLKEILSFGRVDRGRDFWALKDIDLELEPGTTLGIIGRNGAGKSTLLQIVSGVLQPTTGTVETAGQVVLLQLGAGVNPDFTGRENVMLNGLMLGIPREKLLDRFEEIEAFADIGEFMDQPVRTYSSGMRARLGFAVAVNVEPDILIVDETLSVGDAVFKAMGIQKMLELRDRGTTILFVSHGTKMIRNFCNQGLLLHKGEMLYHGGTAEALDRYQALLSSAEAQRTGRSTDAGYEIETQDDEDDMGPVFQENPELEDRAPGLRHGTGEARISSVEILDEDGKPVQKVEPHSTVTARVHLRYAEDIDRSGVEITLRNKAGLDVFSTNTNLKNAPLEGMRKGERAIVDFTFEAWLQPGLYSVSAAVSPKGKNIYLDWVDVAAVFKIERAKNQPNIPGLVGLPTTVSVHVPDGARNDG